MKRSLLLVLLVVIGSSADDGSIVDRCTPLAIIRPSEAIWVAEQEDAWADISKILSQLKRIGSLSTNLASLLSKIDEENKDCSSLATSPDLGYRSITNDKYSTLLYKEDVLGEIPHKINTYGCYLPELNKDFISLVSAFKANNTAEDFIYTVGLLNYLPGAGTTANIQSLQNERIVAITDHTKMGINTQLKSPELRLAAVNVNTFGKPDTEKDETLSMDPTLSVKYMCVKRTPIRPSGVCSIPHKDRILDLVKFGIRTSTEISDWSNGLINKIDALPSRQVSTITTTQDLGHSYIMGSLITSLEKLAKASLKYFEERLEEEFMNVEYLFKQTLHKIQLGDHRSLVVDHVTYGELPRINIKVDYRVESNDGSHYVYGTIFGPTYSTLNLQLLDRLPDRLGRTIIFNYLVTNDRTSQPKIQVALERHPKVSKDCEMFGSQLVCRTQPASSSPDSANCAKALLNLGTTGCSARQYEGKGLKEIMAYCERDPRKYIVSSREVKIEHTCPGDTDPISTNFRGSLRFDDDCIITHDGHAIVEVEEETDWTFDDIKKIRLSLSDTNERLRVGEVFMIASGGSVILIMSIICCSYLHKNNCLCYPCAGNSCNCRCRTINCFPCCKKCRKHPSLRNIPRRAERSRAADAEAGIALQEVEDAVRGAPAVM
jgi:hypothetical protein